MYICGLSRFHSREQKSLCHKLEAFLKTVTNYWENYMYNDQVFCLLTACDMNSGNQDIIRFSDTQFTGCLTLVTTTAVSTF